jgi:hypothetical protein
MGKRIIMGRNDVLDELAWFAEPLFEAASNGEKLVDFFEEFGYVLDPTHISSVNTYFKSLTNTISLSLNDIGTEEANSGFSSEHFVKIFAAIKTVGDNNTIQIYFNTNFFSEIFDYLLYRYLSIKFPFVFALLRALGVVHKREFDSSFRGVNYTQVKFNWELGSEFISDTSKWAKTVYGWSGDTNAGDDKALDYELLLSVMVLIIESFGLSLVKVKELTQSDLEGFIKNNSGGKTFYGASLPILQDNLSEIDVEGMPLFSREAGLKILPYGDLNQPQNLGFALSPYATGNVVGNQPLSDSLILNIDISSEAQGGVYITISPEGISNHTGGKVNAKFALELRYTEPTDGNTIELFRVAETSVLKVDTIKAGFGGDIKGDFYVSGGIENLQATIDLGSNDLLSNFFQEPIQILAGTVNVKWQSGKGISIDGGNNIAITVPVHIQAGPLEITAIGIELKLLEKPTVVFELTGGLSLGPLIMTVDAVGIKAGIKKNEKGIFGNYDLDLGFKPPNGLGLAINAGAVSGGGYLFFDHEKGEYAGALELTIAEFISAKAIGLITTKMPDGSKGFSMLVIITAEFNPPFQLGYGFTLNGVGGLLGLNRTVLLDPLRDGVRTGAVNSIMFPDNVIANATRIISDLKAIFPPIEDRFLIGPMGKVGWGTPSLITLSVGLIIEIPGNVAILGVLKIALPEERIPLVQIQVAFVGTLDFDKKMLTFDASLYESFILHMTLEGDMAVRLKWGDQPDFILTVGGFHPSFNPPPMALPTLRRLSISILNTSIAKIRVECYQAVTSNTVQFGAKAEIYFDLKACSIDGHIAFDALFQFSPFYFIIQLSSSFNLKAAGISVMSVRVKMSLEGTTPWKAKGTGSVSLLLVTISANFNKTWGDKKDTSLPKIEILPKLIEELHEAAQWSTDLVSDKNLLVTLRKLEQAASPELILHPSGSLMVQQKLMPLSVNIDKVGNQKTSDIRKAVISGAFTENNGTQSALEISEVKENFARAQYQELKDSEKLSKPSFEKMPGGVRISMGNNTIRNGQMVRKKVEYDLTIVDKEPVKPYKYGKFFTEIEALFTNFLKGGAVAKSVLSLSHHKKLQPFEEKLDVLEEGYTVAFQSDNKAFDESATFSSEMMAQSYMQDQIIKNPSLKGEVHIILNFELQAA